mmetsp:Transcript_28906/g.43651  ORF Transcript_28906/g.43651 Transcript_28906/m.43651 type:complete len:763 (-) Transcript_28906:41-2329(-)
MKFYALQLALLSIVALCRGQSDSGGCLTLDDLNLPTISRCHNRDIKDALLIAMGTSCGHTPKQEAMFLTGETNHWAAYRTLLDLCEVTIESCVPNSELDFSNVGRCSYWPDILNLIRQSQSEGCTRNAELDASLIVRDMTATPDDPYPELLPWRGGEDSAFEYLKAQCELEVSSCLASYDLLDFTDATTCQLHHIDAEYSSHRREGCTRAIQYDSILLLQEEDDADEPAVYVWSDNNDDTIDAYDVLRDDCYNTNEPCTAMEDLDFENIRACKERYILDEFNNGLEGECPHSHRTRKQDAMVAAKSDDYYAALAILMENCESRIMPCQTLDEFDFSFVDQCDLPRIEKHINKARQEMACPSYDSRPVKDEALLMTGADIYRKHHNTANDGTDAESILIETCKERIKSCSLQPGSSLEVKGCDWTSFKAAVQKGVRENGCVRHLPVELSALEQELLAQTGQTASALINATCADAWGTIPTSTFEQIDSEFTNEFMLDYVDGQTHLNLNTGNFQGEDVGERDGEIGENINEFRHNEAELTSLEGFAPLQSCQNQAIMCCFGRDRQFGDNNGNCRQRNCNDRDPADNSNLCKTNTQAYPNNDAPENQIHCHGFAWGSDENDFARQLMFNNFFYVSLYDHMYTRGYVERTIPSDPDDFRMCDCIEDMPPVTRSDCTEVDLAPFVVSRSEAGDAITAEAPDTLDIEFNSCRGLGRNNDLSTHIKRLVSEGRMSEDMQSKAYETLVGYENPRDNNNEEACEAIVGAGM